MKAKRSIRALEQKSAKGDIKAKFTLANYYSTGHYVEEDQDRAEELLGELKSFSDEINVRIENIRIVNFRRFLDVDIPIHPKLTIFVGDNGFGKTTVLDALTKSLSWFTANLKREGNPGNQISALEINNSDDADYASITTTFSINKETKYKSTVAKEKEGSKASQSGDHAEIKALSDLYRYLHSANCGFNLPIILNCPVDRAVEVKQEDFKKASKLADTKSWNEYDAYAKTYADSQDFSYFMAWLSRFDSIASKESKDAWTNKQQIIEYKTLLSDEEIASSLSEEAKLKILNRIRKSEVELEETQTSSGKLTSLVVNTVFSALSTFLEEFDNFRIKHSADKVELLIDKAGVTLSALQLSQGEKSLMALVGDIARRLVMLNQNEDKPLEGKGIVLIDEIDLHLHPSWQQEVVPKLLETFPNIQFILTTHSPQVLTTVYPESIRRIAGFKGKAAIEIPPYSYGAESKKMLEEVQGVASRPANTTLIKNLNRYKELISSDEWDSDEAGTLKALLLESYGDHDPIMARLDMDIRMRKRRRDKSRK